MSAKTLRLSKDTVVFWNWWLRRKSLGWFVVFDFPENHRINICRSIRKTGGALWVIESE
jgi:hypothetical protein